ncbi:Pc16g07290 [Penicillium rubens Wisconsin 54-1255]|uniref:Pc16g07290 protein n=1 Tax=Penicillium rubens (strain ATCC 28089 / DSM 1075 / NRRL 1951 / Wisconsin 54-1255) TaxID=500485 RepID=B6H7H1_PENRW|nr:Pc16g07290 [Penicillium rubens Wisconsin 54-1255]
MVEVLLSDTKEHGDKPNKAELMTKALFTAARTGVQVNVARFRRSPLTIAATNGDSELVSLLITYGADPNFVIDQE